MRPVWHDGSRQTIIGYADCDLASQLLVALTVIWRHSDWLRWLWFGVTVIGWWLWFGVTVTGCADCNLTSQLLVDDCDLASQLLVAGCDLASQLLVDDCNLASHLLVADWFGVTVIGCADCDFPWFFSIQYKCQSIYKKEPLGLI
jgi:hypothetical protein